ncbi:hypothetical protein PTNB73_02640 [Pyrenophora teres f. teres]|uniref:Uncharacterized protein n=2 Tax=Pyrenophora teres f. teres TaxID=97479 RepID=E3S0T7_PYRTT|nr:hypothetical protein PTT_15716 [Pyrenophora teres f. teres 0-1]KAE8845310.1 hypothetical protein PTNB85_03575 [Pyrenophora teres f. teres]KAE8865542.1 hypothetical protein PTNB29_02689 [Pyrenophora teres f. teres]KAE8871181.1 hypothetical protein PTNB73_02640 [Pyrenophora teres f. teres]CAE7174300.1 hypothetical protein PTTW11_05607 [Pyrenophora teres f. teres]
MHPNTSLIPLLLLLTPPIHANKPAISHVNLNLNPRAIGIPPIPRPALPAAPIPKPISVPRPIQPFTPNPNNPDRIPAADPDPVTNPNGTKPKDDKPDGPDIPDTPDNDSDSPDSDKPDRDPSDVPDSDDGSDKPDDRGSSSTTITTRSVTSGSATVTSSGITSTSLSLSTSTRMAATMSTGAEAWKSFIDAGPSPTAEGAPVSTPVMGGAGRVEALGLGMVVSLAGVLGLI